MASFEIGKIVPVFVEFIPEELEQNKIYISREYNTASHLCMCGCKSLVVTPLNKNGWTIIESNGLISLTPSIGNKQFTCQSHYIIKENIAINAD